MFQFLKKKYYTFCLFVFSFLTYSILYSQTTNSLDVDSLIYLNKSGKLNPTGKYKLYEHLFIDNYLTNKTIAKKYNDSLYLVSRKFKLKSGLGQYYQNISFMKFNDEDYKLALHYCQISKKYFTEDKNYEDYLFSITKECVYLRALNKVEESFQLASKNIKLFKNKSILSGLGGLYLNVAEYYFDKKKYNNAILNAKSALVLFQKDKYFHGIAECDLLMAVILVELEEYSEAISYIKRLVELPEELRKNEVYNYLYLAYMVEFHIKSKKYLEAIQYANKAIQKFKKAKFDYYVIEMQLCKADAHQKLGNNETAISILKIIEKNIDKHRFEGDIDNSLKYINEIKANIFSAKKQYNLALNTLQKNLKFKEIDIKTYEEISKVQFKLKLYKEAFENLQFYNKKKIEQLTVNQKNNLDELQLLYNKKDNEFKIQDLKLKKANNELLLKKTKDFSNKIILALIVLFFVLIFLYYNYRVKKKVSQILTYKNYNLEVSNTNLFKSNREKEILLKEIHHRVKNNLQLVMSMINIQSKLYDVDEFIELSSNRIHSMLLIHQTLYQGDSLVSIDFKNYLTVLTSTILETFEKDSLIKIEIDSKNIEFNTSTTIPLGLIVNEIVNNALKHAFPNNIPGTIKISLIQTNENRFQLMIEDNGIGFSSDHLNNKSFGLELINLLTLQLHGTLSIDSSPLSSTKYSIYFQEIID